MERSIIPVVPRSLLKDGAIYYYQSIMDTLRINPSKPMFLPVMNGAIQFWSWLRWNYTWIEKNPEYIARVKARRTSGSNFIEPEVSIGSWDIKKCIVEDGTIFIVEDIVDSGKTIIRLKQELVDQGVQPNRIGVISMLMRDNSSEVPIRFNSDPVRYLEGIPVWTPWLVGKNYFWVGCGMDFNDAYRDLPFLGYLEEKQCITS